MVVILGAIIPLPADGTHGAGLPPSLNWDGIPFVLGKTQHRGCHRQGQRNDRPNMAKLGMLASTPHRCRRLAHPAERSLKTVVPAPLGKPDVERDLDTSTNDTLDHHGRPCRQPEILHRVANMVLLPRSPPLQSTHVCRARW